MSDNKSTPAAVFSLKKQLQNAINDKRFNEAVDILKVFRDEVIATQELIRETKIGITINKLRQVEDKATADISKEIIRKWKSAVAGNKSDQKSDGSNNKSSTNPDTADKPASASNAKPSAKISSMADVKSSKGTTEKRDPKLGPRTTETDKVDITTVTTSDTARDKFLKLLYDAMASDSAEPSQKILEKGAELERHLHNTLPEAQYRTKLRSLYMNLKAANNPELRARVVSGVIPVAKLANMTPQEMAPKELQDLNKKLEAENLFKAQGAAPQQAETDGFQCGKCKQRRTMYYQMQTRSADEPMTTFVTCLVCDNRWKFS